MKLLLTGGGTLGPVTPLLAVVEAWRKKDPRVQCLWIGTSHGPERFFIEKEGIPFYAIMTARFPRYLSIEWIQLPFRFLIACVQALFLLLRNKPDLIASAGGYTSIPVVLIGRLLNIPSWVHQSDVVPLLTNRILAPFASLITVAFDQTRYSFPASKTMTVGNLVRAMIFEGSKEDARQRFDLDEKKPTVLVFGGGGGAKWINQVMQTIWKNISEIANVIHVTGKGKSETLVSSASNHYHVAEFLSDEMADALAIADVVVCRAGTGTLSELAALKKAAILIPLPNHAQQENARAVRQAAVILDQSTTTAEDVLREIRLLLVDDARRLELGERLSQILETNVVSNLIDLLIPIK